VAAAIAALVVLVAGGCSDDGAESLPTSSTTPSTAEVESSSTTASTPETTTTTSSATTPTTTGATFSEVETAVRAAHTRFMTELFNRDERVDGYEPSLLLAEELTVAPLLTRFQESTAGRSERGEHLAGPGFDSNIVNVLIDGGRASVLDCSLDRGSRYGPNGELMGAGGSVHQLRETLLVQVAGSWLVEEFITGGSEECDSAEYS